MNSVPVERLEELAKHYDYIGNDDVNALGVAGRLRALIASVTEERVIPSMPELLDGETMGQYTDRLTGADGTSRRPHPDWFRQCSIGYHDECSDPEGQECKCPCHHKAEDTAAELREAAQDVLAVLEIGVDPGPHHMATLDGRAAWIDRMRPVRERLRAALGKDKGEE